MDSLETRTATRRANSIAQGERVFNPSDSIGRYRVVELVGVGGMGEVYRGYDPKLDRAVALKILRRAEASASLLDEARALARLSHPNVVAVHEVENFGDQVVVVMEYCEGITLKQWAQVNPPSEEPERFVYALRLLEQAGRGLAAAHCQGLIHRDFKPSNVLLTNDGQVRVADFGLAVGSSSADPSELSTNPSDSRTGAGVVAGTPRYMSPEQARGGVMDARSDQYSFAVVAWEVLFGEPPSSRPPDTLHLVKVEPSRISEVALALRKGLAIRPPDRFDDLSQLIERMVAVAPRGLELAAIPDYQIAGPIACGIGAAGTTLLRDELSLIVAILFSLLGIPALTLGLAYATGKLRRLLAIRQVHKQARIGSSVDGPATPKVLPPGA